ncbi:MAG: bifunctional diguanylate cyclase/phosphodiesterase [Sedimentibacter sp.]|uniref:putative bifunctional diguanylate cyclase/phosphodiesterase n=1 Tax=Sedimentibacter sp. TaxID=1960295 RepID=UPI0031593472
MKTRKKDVKALNRNEGSYVAMKYLAAGMLWILLSDVIADLIFDGIAYKQFQTYKGGLFIIVTTLFLYVLVNDRMKIINKYICKILSLYDELKKAHEETVKYESRYKYMALYDELTELPNKQMFRNKISELIDQCEVKNFAIAYIDIDNFNYVNDTLGHDIGDYLLISIAKNLKNEVKEPCVVSRFGGDEFAILFSNVESDRLQDVIEDIKGKISKTWMVYNNRFNVSMSIGVVCYPNHGDNSTALLKNADIALNAAKKEGKNRVQFYTREIEKINLKNIEMINKIKSGIEKNEFTLHYQPQYVLNSGEIKGVEALIRWEHPAEGIISPAEFIPLAEEYGEIASIEKWVMNTALEQKSLWEKQGFDFLELSINMSAKTLACEDSFSIIERILLEHDVDYSNIVLEITETSGLYDLDLIIERLKKIKNNGVKIALDDFGTGYSSLTYLKRLPIDYIKLDRSFIDLIPQNSIDATIVEKIISLANGLNYKVVAEGIETLEQLEYLKLSCCDYGQGFLMSRPLRLEEVNNMISCKASHI